MPSFLQMTMRKEKKPKAASLNNIKTPAQTALFLLHSIWKIQIYCWLHGGRLPFLKWDSEVFWQNMFTPVDKSQQEMGLRRQSSWQSSNI